jgi:hypothetical protein
MIKNTFVVSNKSLKRLEDICTINILSDFSIIHNDYTPYNLQPDVISFLKQLPKLIQNQHINLQLRSFLYDVYFNGSFTSNSLDVNLKNNSLTKTEIIENNTLRGINRDFYNAIYANNNGTGYYDNGWLVLQEKDTETLVVQKDELTLHLKRNRHLRVREQSAKLGDKVDVMMPNNLIEYGYYIAVGDAGLAKDKLVNIYFNFTSHGALLVMESLTKRLNLVGVTFQFKVLNNPEEYGRYDSGVLQFNSLDYSIIKEELQVIYNQYKPYFSQESPIFTKILAPGLSLAEEPNYKFNNQEDFGMNRCRIIANALIDAWEHGDNSKEVKMAAIRQHFFKLGIVIELPYLNPESKDIYLLFN